MFIPVHYNIKIIRRSKPFDLSVHENVTLHSLTSMIMQILQEFAEKYSTFEILSICRVVYSPADAYTLVQTFTL